MRIKLQADVVNGVYEVDEFDKCLDKVKVEIYDNQEYFYEDLKTMLIKKVIAVEADEEMVKKIHEEYGIR